MEYTEKELIENGIIKREGKIYLNAVVECHSNGGTKGIWIDGIYHKAIHHIHTITFNFPNTGKEGKGEKRRIKKDM